MWHEDIISCIICIYHVSIGPQVAWIFSTGIGILLFLAQMAILAWVRFYGLSQGASIASAAIILPVLVVFVIFAVHFYRQLIAHKYERSTRSLEEAETIASDLYFKASPILNV